MNVTPNQLNQHDYLVRISSIVRPDGVLPISKSSFLKGVKDGLYPKPIKLGPRITCWKWSEINKLISHGVEIKYP